MRSKTGITEPSFFLMEILKTTDIISAQIIRNNKWNNIIAQTFFEQKKPSNAPISVAEWMDLFKSRVER